jgi:hypothetical protein
MSPGQPRSRPGATADNTSQQRKRRPVRSEDPSLSDSANELLTHELRAAIGAAEVVVSEDAPNRREDRHATRSRLGTTLSANRLILIVTFVAAVVVGGVVALVTEQYWAVVLAAALHAMGTLVVAGGAIELTTNIEHVSPAVAARLEEEGVADPDRVLSELIVDFADGRDARGVPEVITTGHNEARRQLVPVALLVVAGVIWFMVVVGWIAGLL